MVQILTFLGESASIDASQGREQERERERSVIRSEAEQVEEVEPNNRPQMAAFQHNG